MPVARKTPSAAHDWLKGELDPVAAVHRRRREKSHGTQTHSDGTGT